MDIQQHLDSQESQEVETEETETEPQKSYRGKSSLKRLKDRLKLLDKIATDPKVRAAKQADVAIEAAGIEKLLFQTERDDKADKNLALNEQLTAQVTAQQEEISRLTQLNAEQSRATQKIQPERIPDAALQEKALQVQTLEELLKAVSALARSVDIELRTRHAVSLVIKYGKQAMSVVEGLGVDALSVAVALQKSETELLGLLQQAEREGTGTPIWRAVLFVRDAIQVDRHGKRQYCDEFESSLYADSL
jgi:hypothetical protein